jgi:hypothetical protein
MSLRSLNLDDRRFKDLMQDAIAHAERHSGWRPNNAGDPGTILLELFTHLTETMIYRVNRLPEKVYIELLRVMGVELGAPCAATARLQFSIAKALDHDVSIAQDTRVACGDKGPEFMTLGDAQIPVGAMQVEVLAINAKWVDYQLIGSGTGHPGQALSLPHSPLIASVPDRVDLIVAVELGEGETPKAGEHYRHSDGKTYRIWQEVDNFSAVNTGECVYRVSRVEGVLHFAPTLLRGQNVQSNGEPLATVPEAGLRVLARYRMGGGIEGNVGPHRVTKLIDKVPSVSLAVTNLGRALGGDEQESLSNALIRGPLELHSLQRAVTAQDFELIAIKQSGLVNRAHAYTKREQWQYAAPGTVEVVLVPQVSGDQGRITPTVMLQNQNADIAEQIQSTLAQRKPLGTQCIVSWCRYKSVKANVCLTVHREENREAVKTRILERLYDMVTPLVQSHNPSAWPFGKALGAYDIYRILTSEPGVKAVDPVVLEVSHVPNKDVTHIDADSWQHHTWYAAAGDALYRTINNGTGWEQINQWSDEEVVCVKSFPRENQIVAEVAGLVIALTRSPVTKENTLYLSRDCGETWSRVRKPDFIVNDVVWIERSGRPSLLIASEKGLFEQSVVSAREWKSVVIDPDEPALAARSVTVATNQAGTNYIAVATPPDSGVYLSVGPHAVFKNIGLKSKIVSVLNIQYLDTQRYLWAGLSAVGDDSGQGCYRWQLQDSGDSAEGWKPTNKNWAGGGCTALGFVDKQVYAASKRLGVMTLSWEDDLATWRPANVNCGLPMERLSQFEVVNALAITPSSMPDPVLLAAGPQGIYRQVSGESTFQHCSPAHFNDRVSLPANWLFCSADHNVTVNYD